MSRSQQASQPAVFFQWSLLQLLFPGSCPEFFSSSPQWWRTTWGLYGWVTPFFPGILLSEVVHHSNRKWTRTARDAWFFLTYLRSCTPHSGLYSNIFVLIPICSSYCDVLIFIVIILFLIHIISPLYQRASLRGQMLHLILVSKGEVLRSILFCFVFKCISWNRLWERRK